MCGICGKFNFHPEARVSPALVASMLAPIAHRGPDDQGVYTSAQIGLGHRRLSIIGLATGHQPLSNEDGTVWVTYNGEIYNYPELRRQLESRGHRFTTDTDTEVIVHLYEDSGVDCVRMLEGMFAFGLWDERRRQLLLARDRVGIKPLYYRLAEDSITFASELKAILADPAAGRSLDPDMIERFLTFLYMPGQETLLRGIRKLEPGTFMVVRHGQSEIRRYWDLEFPPGAMSFPEAAGRLRAVLAESVRRHMISDVPVGVLLSGGFDSTAILSLATDFSKDRLRSYTVGFDSPGVVDERPYARIAAATCGSEHREMTIGPRQFLEALPKYVWHMEEPVCEPPAIALYLVSKLARQDNVKVLLSGEGGDEAFAGYPSYRNINWLETLKSAAPLASRLLGSAMSHCGRALASPRLSKYGALLRTEFDRYYLSRSVNPASLFYRQAGLHPLSGGPSDDRINRMLYLDTKTWLPDDLLVKADKMTMAASVELRVPFLDHHVLEFAASLPGSYKVRGWETKCVAKAALRSRVPDVIRNRPKAGFPVPYAHWLRSGLQAHFEPLLLDSRSLSSQYFGQRFVEDLVTTNRASGRLSRELFSLVVLELWNDTFVRAAPQPLALAAATR